MPFLKLLFATTNPDKLTELKTLVKNLPIQIQGINDIPGLDQINIVETGSTFIENAELKAISYGRLSGIPTIADDSGLCVEALGGQPGVLSARYAPTPSERIAKLLSELKLATTSNRAAYFESAICLFNPSSDKTRTFTGRCYGHITTETQGEAGFGYDPIFYSNDLQMTFAEAGTQAKNTVSHRAVAFAKLYKAIKKMC